MKYFEEIRELVSVGMSFNDAYQEVHKRPPSKEEEDLFNEQLQAMSRQEERSKFDFTEDEFGYTDDHGNYTYSALFLKDVQQIRKRYLEEQKRTLDNTFSKIFDVPVSHSLNIILDLVSQASGFIKRNTFAQAQQEIFKYLIRSLQILSENNYPFSVKLPIINWFMLIEHFSHFSLVNVHLQVNLIDILLEAIFPITTKETNEAAEILLQLFPLINRELMPGAIEQIAEYLLALAEQMSDMDDVTNTVSQIVLYVPQKANDVAEFLLQQMNNSTVVDDIVQLADAVIQYACQKKLTAVQLCLAKIHLFEGDKRTKLINKLSELVFSFPDKDIPNDVLEKFEQYSDHASVLMNKRRFAALASGYVQANRQQKTFLGIMDILEIIYEVLMGYTLPDDEKKKLYQKFDTIRRNHEALDDIKKSQNAPLYRSLSPNLEKKALNCWNCLSSEEKERYPEGFLQWFNDRYIPNLSLSTENEVTWDPERELYTKARGEFYKQNGRNTFFMSFEHWQKASDYTQRPNSVGFEF